MGFIQRMNVYRFITKEVGVNLTGDAGQSLNQTIRDYDDN